MATKWSADVRDRLVSLHALAATSGTVPDAENFIAHGGRYVLLHFDLLTIDSAGAKLDRSRVYRAVHAAAAAQGGIHLGGSVYGVPLGAAPERSVERAVLIWNAVATATAGDLREGDALFVHYATDTVEQMGGIAQVVPPKASRVVSVKPPKPKP